MLVTLKLTDCNLKKNVYIWEHKWFSLKQNFKFTVFESWSDLSTNKWRLSPRSVNWSIFSHRICFVASISCSISLIFSNDKFSLYRFLKIETLNKSLCNGWTRNNWKNLSLRIFYFKFFCFGNYRNFPKKLVTCVIPIYPFKIQIHKISCLWVVTNI